MGLFTLCIMSAILSVYEIDKHTFDCTLTCGFVIRHYLQSMSKYANVVLKYSVLTANQKHLAGPESWTSPYQQCPKCHVHHANY